MKVLVTGGAGFIGSHIVEHFQGKAEVRVLDNLRSGFRQNLDGFQCQFIQGSVLDRDLVRQAVEGVDYIFHLAAMISVPESMQKPIECTEINTLGTLVVLEEAAKAKVKKLVLSSSAAIYGDNPTVPKLESMLPEPKSPYAISKLDGEFYCKMFADEGRIQTASLRYFNVFGPRQDPKSPYAAAVPIFIDRAVKHEPITIHGDGEQTRDFIYVKDIVAANVYFATQSAQTGVHNVAYGQRMTINDLARTICQITGSRSKIEHAPVRAGDVKHSQASIDKLRAAGFTPASSLSKGLLATVEFFQKKSAGPASSATAPKPSIIPPLDPEFQPAVLADRNYVKNARKSGTSEPVVIGLERENGLLSRHETIACPDASPETLRYVERVVKFLLWARGGWKIYFSGPTVIGEHLQRCYSKEGARAFDVDFMSRVYEQPFEVVLTSPKSFPDENEMSAVLGGHQDGCRLGFDLNTNEYRVAAVKDGELLYSDTVSWNPQEQADPDYHYNHLNAALKKAATHLPRVDAIGGSSAGVIVDNRIMVANLFRAVPPAKADAAKNLFQRLSQEWNVPVEVANDGDVTALAGAMEFKTNGVLGVAMRSSEGTGYLNTRGCMTGWLNELAFAPVDYNPNAPADEWSGDRGVGASYFSQQAIGRLLGPAGIETDPGLDLAGKLNLVESLMDKGDPRAGKIYQTIGTYFGYAIAHYACFYQINNILLDSRVTTGPGGSCLVEKAREVLKQEFPALAEKIRLLIPDQAAKRHGQAVAAATLPCIWNRNDA